MEARNVSVLEFEWDQLFAVVEKDPCAHLKAQSSNMTTSARW